MTKTGKLAEYRDYIESLNAISSYEVYRWIISLGKKLREEPLEENRRIPANRVTNCQSELYVDFDNGLFKAWSNALITSGYAYLLTDIFNHSSADQISEITPENFEALGLDNMLSMMRKAGFYQMIEMMRKNFLSKNNLPNNK
jgi:sulfur transfer protein SufE